MVVKKENYIIYLTGNIIFMIIQKKNVNLVFLIKKEKGYANKVLLTDIVSKTEWRKRFKKRGVAFF